MSEYMPAQGFKEIVKGDSTNLVATGEEVFEEDWYAEFKRMVTEARNYEDDYLQPLREEYSLYYEGYIPDVDNLFPRDFSVPTYNPDDDEEPVERDQSSFVSTDVKDTIMGMIPSLIRIFAAREDPIQLVPNRKDMVEHARQAKKYLNHVFWEDNQGFLILHSILKDALIKRVAIATWYTELEGDIVEETFNNITVTQLTHILVERPGSQLRSAVLAEGNDPDNIDAILDEAVVRYEEQEPRHCVGTIPPEEFRISPRAASAKDAPICGHECYKTKSFLRKLGVSEEILDASDGVYDDYSTETFLRDPGVEIRRDEQGVLYGKWYAFVDVDGDGIDELRHICTVGEQMHVVKNELVGNKPYALFCPDPTPHSAIGDAITGMVSDIQRIKSNIIRRTLDNLANSVLSRIAVNEITTNVADAMNTDQSPVVRVRGNPNQAIMNLATDFVGDKSLQVVNYFDSVRAARTGITEASKGLDPEAMQSTAVVGINAIVEGAQERIELVARILAETGFKDMYEGLYAEVVNSPNHTRNIELQGEWSEVDPSSFEPGLRCRVNPTLGRGSDHVRLATLHQVNQWQTLIIEKYGIKNPTVGISQWLNTVEDILELANIKDMPRYFKAVTPEQEKQIMDAPEEPSAEKMIATAELERVKSSMITKFRELREKKEIAEMQDDTKRDAAIIDGLVRLFVAKFARDDKADEVKDIGTTKEPG